MPVLGVDMSVASCGFAVADGLKILHSEVFKTKDSLPHVARRLRILKRAMALGGIYGADTVVVETVRLFHRSRISMDAILGLEALSATLENWAFLRDIALVKVATNSWKAVVLGNGRADKDAAVTWARVNYGKNVKHDEADAMALAVYPATRERRLGVEPKRSRKVR